MSENPPLPPAELPPKAEPVATNVAKKSHSWIPWTLVGILTVALVGMSIALGVRTNEVNALRVRLGDKLAEPVATNATRTQAPTDPAGAAEPAISAAPTTGAQAQTLLKLARRTPGDPMALGKPDAKVTLVEWADYRCPFCAKWSLQTLPALKNYIDAGQLRVEFRDMPLFGAESELAAAAARAAGQQGKFWELSDEIWRLHTGNGHPSVTKENMLTAAKNAGVANIDAFTKALDDPAIRQQIAADREGAAALGINGTPHFVVNATRIPGALGTESFVSIIEQYLKSK